MYYVLNNNNNKKDIQDPELFKVIQVSKKQTNNQRNKMPLQNYHDSLLAILTPLSLKLMFRTDSGHRRSGLLDLGIGPLHMLGNQFC